MEFFDTHAHLDDERLQPQLADVLGRAVQAGVQTVVAIGTTAETSTACLNIAKIHAGVRCAVGIQPNHVAEATSGSWDEIVRLSADPEVVAIGESGLDRYWDHAPFELQQDFFDRHLELSRRTALPIVIHMRSCGDDVLLMLQRARQRGPLRGVMHSYTGDRALMEACVDLGLHISFAGMVTYKNSAELRAVAALVPDDRLLIETDSPYLSPHPHRQQRPNEPALVVHTAGCLADVRGVTLAEIASTTTRNARALFAKRT